MGDRTRDALESIKFIHNMNTLTNRLKEKFVAFRTANSNVEQQSILKELPQCIETSEERMFVAHLISHMYLKTSSRHPLKKTCTRILLSMESEVVKNAIAEQIKHFIARIQEKKAAEAENADRLDDGFIAMMQGLFSNFPPGVEALSRIVDEVFLYAFDVFLKDIDSFESDKLPMDVAQQMLYNSTKFLDTLLHHCDTSVHLPKKSTTLLVKSYKMIRHDKISFNTKAHSGALLVMAVVQCPDNIEQGELNSLAALLHIPPIKAEDNLLTAMLQSCADCFTTRICIFSGIVHTCPLHVMSKYMVDDTPVAIYIFKNMLDIAKKRSTIAPEILEISRTLVSLSPLISNIKIELLADMMKSCWDYIWMHLDHFVDAVRQDAQKLLRTFITITLELTGNVDENADNDADSTMLDCNRSYLNMFTSAISEIIDGRNPNFKALAHIASAMKCQILLNIFPNLPSNLLASLTNASVAQDVCTAYERLMEQHHKEMPDTWIATWVHPIIPLKHPDPLVPYILRIFNAAFKLDPEVVLLISNSATFTEHELRALLGCIITARKNNIKFDSLLNIKNGKPWNGISIFNKSHLQMLLCHKSAEIRILVLTLLVECQKTTEIFTFDDFKVLVTFFRYNSSSPFPNFRQNMTALYKKALNRFKDSYYVIQRSIRNEEARTNTVNDDNADKLKVFKDQEAYYKEFVITFFHQQLLRGLYYQAEHGKRSMCLELLIHLKSCLPEELYNAQWSVPDYVQMLFGAFDDTYESNLIMVRKLLLDLPPNVAFPQGYIKEFEVLMKRYVLQIAFDIKPNITASATYAILVHIRSPSALTLIQKNFSVGVETGETCPALLIQKELTAQINTELAVARKDLLMAAKYAPIYGLLYCLRHLIQKEQLDIQHPSVIPNLVQQCLKVVDLASPIINSSAPEGYNPEHVDYAKANVTPQLVLLYAWRTIKEVSLLFGELQINDAKVKELMKRETTILESISKYFIELFEAAKHRGAYEQGYVGFAKFTEKLWNSGCEWAKLPEQWLENTLKLITSIDGNICETRRSAGIPFMIQAILITEPKHRSSKSFHHCMQYLLAVAENYAVENQKSAIHSMNTLRALFRHNQLGEVVASYVSQAVMIAITQFSHPDWAIRNAATLMFSALMMRMFGVQRLKDHEEISIKNRLSFKIFTTRYPELYKFLFAKLDAYVADPQENVSLYPILLILGRIYLTFDAKKDDELLIQHLHSIIKASNRTIYKIRELAVQASVTFEFFLNQRVRLERTTNNQLHGYLLQLKYRVRQATTQLTLDHFKPLFVIIIEAGKGISQTCATLLMDILIDFLKIYDYRDDDLDTYKQMLSCMHMKQDATVSTCSRFQQTKLTLYLHVVLKIPQAQWYKRTFIASALLQALASRNEDLNIYALNCIRYISSNKIKEPEQRELEYDFVKTLQPQTKSLLDYIIRVHLMKRRMFMDLFDILRNRSRRYALKVCQVLYNYPSIVFTIRPLAIPVKLSHQIILDYLVRQATNIDADMFVAIMGLISKFVAGSNEHLNLRDLIYHMIEYGSADESSIEERMAIANFLLKNYNLLINVNLLEDTLRNKLWSIYLDLMQDDEYVVRDFCNQISIRILSESSNVFPLHERYLKNFPLIPERLHEEVLARLPLFVGRNHALKIYATLSLQYEEADVYTDEATVFEKMKASTFKESRPFAAVAKHHLARNLWLLDHGLSYEDKTIFLEEHFLLVATKLLNIIIQQDDTDDRTLCASVLKAMIKYLEHLKIGAATVERIMDNFARLFKLAVAGERSNNMQMSPSVIEVSQFLTSILFTCREGRDECKCDNLL